MKKKPPSPFPTVARAASRVEIDPAMLEVEHNTPMPIFRSKKSDKYGELFATLKPGSCVRCEPKEVPRVAQSLRKALDVGRYKVLAGCKVLSRTKCEDGHGRVWAMPASRK